MAIVPIRRLGDPILRSPASEVQAFDGTLRRVMDDMFETMYDAPGVGLAAPQVGISLRFFVYDDGDGSKGAVANPTLSLMEGEQIDEEGCLSIPGLYYETPRAMRVRVEGMDVQGRRITVEGEGLVARIFQHETDHLEGMLYIDRLSADDRRQAMALLREQELTGRPARPQRPPRRH